MENINPDYPLPQGPFFVYSDTDGFHICYNQHQSVIRQSIAHNIEEIGYARRICAALNACCGISTEDLEKVVRKDTLGKN